MSTASEDLTDQIAFIDLVIVELRAAMLAFATNGAQQEYRYNDGQQDVRVVREPAKDMLATISGLMNEKQILCQRLGTASGTLNTRGAW